ncbi:MAG: Mu family bacteriophage transposase [Roseibaca calidilacus]|uniref:Transposase n=1 Tax=Roseibaca calidilacus TaxID=1666912 RepID=A0A0P8A5T1_9RHOB|nr:transposase domain-containing protein [Roseibaca calidilacus]KPP89493.1 MAG: Mu family bacteriophage transposase [Roseibaca calidilacus]CUX79371.1 putative transposase [Roseibaca calidilacus]
MTPVKELLGVGAIPRDKTSARKWLERNGITVHRQPCPGGERLVIDPAELPQPELQAFAAALGPKDGRAQGEWDGDAWEAFLAAAPTRRADAERKAKIACALQQLRDSGVKWADCHGRLSAQFNGDMLSVASLKRLLAALKGVDQINYAPALLTAHTGRTVEAEMSEAAWKFFLKTIHLAHQDFPIIQAWRDTRDVAQKQGWRWPAYETVNRRWKALPYTERLTARVGQKEAQKRLSQPVLRDKTSIHALEWVSLDGRTLDFFIEGTNGSPLRPTFLALVDVASTKILGWKLASAEDAATTKALIVETVRKYGLFDKLYTDNGRAFAGNLIAGGNPTHFRKKRKLEVGTTPPGVCALLGIKMHFALPRNGRAKEAERTFRTLSRSIDDRPEFKGAHAGHSVGEKPDSSITPVTFEFARSVITREVERHNTETGRRNQGANGRSYDQQFNDLMAGRVLRKATEQQLYHASLTYEWRAVDLNGRIKINNWVYGDHTSVNALMPHHEKKKKVLFGYDPTNFSAPGVAYDESMRLICADIAHVKRGDYDSSEGVQQASKNKKAARKAAQEADAATNLLAVNEYQQLLAELDEGGCDTASTEVENSKVVAGHFASPLRGSKKPTSEHSSDPKILAVLQQFKTEGLKKRNEA